MTCFQVKFYTDLLRLTVTNSIYDFIWTSHLEYSYIKDHWLQPLGLFSMSVLPSHWHNMVNLIYDRGVTDLAREMSIYFSIFSKYARIKLFHAKPALFGSADVINVCNLHCTHCYWWLNRKGGGEQDYLGAEQWREIIRKTFKKLKIPIVTLVGGEPTIRPDIIQVFCEEMPKRVCVVSNGTYP